jgi:hypothetical protein
MPNYLIEYRLRIRNASTVTDPNGTADALTISSVAGGTNPYLAGPPSGDGQEIDPVTGQTRTGSYVVEVVDAATGTDGTGTIRVVTNALEDAGYLQQLLGRRAYVETRTDGGSWTGLTAGYVLSIRLVAPARYAITVGDTRRVEQTQPIFTGSSIGSYATRGTLIGGPVTSDWGVAKARGGWRYKLTSIGGNYWRADFQDGYLPPTGPITRDLNVLYNQTALNVIATKSRPNADIGSTGFDLAFATVASGAITDGIVPYIGSTSTNAAATDAVLVYNELGFLAYPDVFRVLNFYWPSCPYSTGAVVFISLTTTEVREECPLYVDAHPIDIVTAIWTGARVRFNTGGAWIAAAKAAIGENVRLALRFTEAPIIAQFLDDAICGPFGLAVRTNSLGDQEMVVTRILTTATPSLTIAPGDLSSADPVVFDLDERTAINSVTLTQQLFTASPQAVAPQQGVQPPDGIQTTEINITARYTDAALTTFAGRDVSFRVPGMIHTASDFSPNPTVTLEAIGRNILPRFGRGSPVAEVQVLASAASAAAQVGDEVYLEAPHYPNRNYRIGESTVGARIMQVIWRTETPTGPSFRLLDSGINAQPVSPAATITIAASTANPYSVAEFTITNAATINSGGVLGVEVEWGTGATPTSNGIFQRYLPGAVPTGAVALTAVQGSGTQVQVRARTTQTGRRPSAWTAWASVTLTAIPTPGAITVGTTTATSVAISWTNTSTAYPLFVFAYLGGSAPAQWEPYLVTTLPPGSTSTVIRTLEAGTYQLAIAYSTPTGRGPVRTASVTTSGTGSTATRPAGIALVPLLDDATLEQGIALGLYASDQTLDFVIERSAVSGSSFGEIARVPGSTAVYVDRLARDGFTYYYRAKHALGGFVTSAATGEVSGIARGVPAELLRPAPVVPTVGVEITESSTTGTVTLVITDPQGRLTEVRFRDDPGTGVFGAWTVDSAAPYTYSATIPTTGFLRIEYEVQGFGADGIERVLASGIESFDRGRVANIVSAAGLFSTVGVLTVSVQGDTDTASIKYAVSATPWASDAVAYAAAQAGTLINARNGTFTDTGPWSVGAVAYVAFAAYDAAGGSGNVSGPYRYAFTNGARNTIPLTARARLLSLGTTDATIRVGVACPVAPTPNSATIRYAVVGLSGVLPTDSSGNTVVPELADSVSASEPFGSYIDFTVPYPAQGDPAGRITFTVTAVDRVSATDAADVSVQGLIAPSLNVVTTPGTTSYSIQVTWDGSIAYKLDGVTQSVSGWTSPRTVTVTRNAPGGQNKVAEFAVTKDGITISNTVDVPAQPQTAVALPSLSVVTTPATTSYSLLVTWSGTIAYVLDGATQSVSGWTSPRTVTINRNAAGGQAKVAVFEATDGGSTIGNTVTIEAQVPTPPAFTQFYPDNSFAPNDGGGSFDINFQTANMPTGTTYDLDWFITAGVYLGNTTGSATGVTDGQTINFPFASAPTGEFVIRAILAGQVIATAAFQGAF